MASKASDFLAVGKELFPKGKRNFTKFTLHENGEPLTRRSHGLLVQAKNGRVFLIDGPDLPLTIDVFTGTVQGGRNLVQILMNPDSEEGFELGKALGLELPTTPAKAWPTFREFVLFVAGIVLHAMWSVQYEILTLFTR